ncbi:MAG: hypothetical protein L3J72_00695 [Thermoplasmata archaeon]|nr:hypothetical protein [Thermoplasmata archaeon]MCI4341671.1 hypothetical protein [Thermoplasmata archaeon]
MSGNLSLRSGHGAPEALLLPCGHEVTVEAPPLLIGLSQAVLAHQEQCDLARVGAAFGIERRGAAPFGFPWAIGPAPTPV